MLQWNDFAIIVAIQESKTLSAAARTLGLNQSTISRILKRIERDSGQQIFSNTSEGYTATSAGKAYYKTGKEMEMAALTLAKANPANEIQGVVRLSCVEAFVSYLLEKISSFQNQYPKITIELSGSNQNVNLPQRTFHAALRLGRESRSPSVLTKKIAEYGVSVYKARGHTERLNWIGYESTLSSIPEEKWLKRKTGKTRQSLHVSSYLTMEKAIEKGLGMGLLPDFMGSRNELVERLPSGKKALIREVWFVSHPESRRDPAMECFAPWLFKTFEEDRDLFFS
jgi:DNA-binding transcriptional LysR family regulator